MNLVTTIEATAEPLTVSEAKDFLGIDHSDLDLVLLKLIRTARVRLETFLNKKIMPQTMVYYLDEFPSTQIKLPVVPINAVSSIVYIDEAGDEQTWDSEEYEVDIYSSRIRPISGETFPTIATRYNAVRVTFTVGSSSSQVPESYKTTLAIAVKYLLEASPHGDGDKIDLYEIFDQCLGEEKNYQYV